MTVAEQGVGGKVHCTYCGRFAACDAANVCTWCNNKLKLSKSTQIARRNSGSPFWCEGKPRFVSLGQLHRDTLELASMVPPDTVAVVGVARSGMATASLVAMMAHLPLFTIRQTLGDVISCGNGWRLGAKHVRAPKGRVVVIDDTVMTGNSLRAIRPIVEREFGEATTACVYVNPKAARKPDITVHELGWPHLLEWNLFNSVLSPNLACDFDGVFCHDCQPGQDDDGLAYLDFINNARPLYTPRRVPVPLVVTARIEKYREPTLAWLRRQGIRVNQLIMHPAKTLQERRRDDIAAWKAKHFIEWNNRHRPEPAPNGFIESDDTQARRIAQLSGLMVVCPGTAQVYSR